MKKWVLGTAALLSAAAVVGFFWLRRMAADGMPSYDGRKALPGLKAKVTIYRDSLGVPHIVAHNEYDLYYATGYAMAQDRIWQMDLLRRVGAGRLAEVLGERLVETDLLFRKLRIAENARAAYPHLPDSVRAALEAFADGVNAYLAEHADDLPFEFTVLGYRPEPWQPEHSLYLVGNMAWDLETGYKMEAVVEAVRRRVGDAYVPFLLPPESTEPRIYSELDAAVAGPDLRLMDAFAAVRALTTPPFEASNNWAVSGRKSVTGKPLFANDMHLGLHIPGIWWRAHQLIPGKLNVTGVILPGVPFVVAGHNDHIAWGMTNVMLDGADFYVETLDDDSTHYLVDGRWRPLEVKDVRIAVKGDDSPRVHRLYFTHRGPVLTPFEGLAGTVLSMRWVADRPPEEAIALYRLNRASNWTEFRRAVRHFTNVSQNIAYADVDGNIGIQMVGSVPLREGVPYFFYPGDTSAFDWRGTVPFDSLPYEFNPERGFVYSANNRGVDTSYPFYITRWYYWPPYRARRIQQLLTAKERLSIDDFRAMLFDHYSVQAADLLPKMLENLAPGPSWDEIHRQALAMLRSWDFRYGTDRPEPVLFELWLMKWVEAVAADEMGDTLFLFFEDINLFTGYFPARLMDHPEAPWMDDIRTPDRRETFEELLSRAFDQAVREAVRRYGDLKTIQWGAVHPLVLRHPLGQVKAVDWLFRLNRTVPAPGNAHTLNPFKYNWSNPFEAVHGASQKHIFSTADWNASQSVLPTGVSGIPAHPFYCNQTETYVQGGLYPDVFSLEAVEQAARHRLELVPEK